MHPQLSHLRSLLPDATHPTGDRLETARNQIDLIDRQLDDADAWEMAAFREAFRAVFPELKRPRRNP